MYVTRFGLETESCDVGRFSQFIYHLPVIRTNDKSFTYAEGILIHFSIFLSAIRPRPWPKKNNNKKKLKFFLDKRSGEEEKLIVVYRQVFDLKEITSDAF